MGFIVISGDHLPLVIHFWFQIIAIQIIKRSKNFQIMFRDKGVADSVGHHSFDGFLVPAGHDNIGGDPRFFENCFIDGADPLAWMADDKGSVVQLGDIDIRKTVAGSLSVSALRDLVVPGGQSTMRLFRNR